MRMPKNSIKVYLTKEELVTLAGIIGAMHGRNFTELYNELMLHVKGEDEEITYEISKLLDQLIAIDEDNLLYTATLNVRGTDLHK